MIDIASFHSALRSSHIVAGGLGLIVFWIPVFATKGSRLHTVSGKTFVWLAYFVAATASISSVWALAAPISFTGITRDLSALESATVSSNIRFFFSILAVLMTWLVAGLSLGTYSMRTKGQHDSAKPRVLAFQFLAAIASLSLLVFGVAQWINLGESRAFIAIGLGAFGTLDSKKAIKYLLSEPDGDKTWWYTHMECMLGSGIAFHTAFFVFGFSRLFGVQLKGVYSIAPWLIPAAVGTPAIFIWINRYRKRFHTNPTASTASTANVTP